MNIRPTPPELRPGEPHPAVRLAEAVCALIATIAGPSWFWRFLPGGRALWAGLHQLGQDFAALMLRIAAAPAGLPAPITIAPITNAPIGATRRQRQRVRTGEVRPRRTRQPRPASLTRRPAAPWHRIIDAPRPATPLACAVPTLRERRRRTARPALPPAHA